MWDRDPLPAINTPALYYNMYPNINTCGLRSIILILVIVIIELTDLMQRGKANIPTPMMLLAMLITEDQLVDIF